MTVKGFKIKTRRYSFDIPSIFLRYSFDIPSIFLRYFFGIPSVFLRYSFGIGSLFLRIFIINPFRLYSFFFFLFVPLKDKINFGFSHLSDFRALHFEVLDDSKRIQDKNTKEERRWNEGRTKDVD